MRPFKINAQIGKGGFFFFQCMNQINDLIGEILQHITHQHILFLALVLLVHQSFETL